MSDAEADVAALRRERDALSATVSDLREALARAERRFDLFASTLPGISWEVWGRPDESLINYVSASAERMMGYSLDTWQSRPGFFCGIIHPDDQDRIKRELDASYARGDVHGVLDCRVLTSAGEPVWLHTRYSILRDETGAPFAWQAFSLDVTAQRRAETDRDRTQEQLIHAEKMASLGLLVAGIAHEIKNPLNFVNNFAELALEFLDELRTRSTAGEADPTDILATLDEVAENLARIREHGQRADNTINTMLMHARDRRGEPIELDVNAMLVEYTNLAYHGFRASDRVFAAEIVAELDPAIGVLTGPYQDLARVVVNLVSNACHAMRERQRTAEPGYRAVLTIASRLRDSRFELTIADNGTGISAEAARRLFDPFFTTKPPGEGTGLGLSLSYEIVVKELGGSIDVTSTPGDGAHFTVCVPIRGTTVDPAAMDTAGTVQTR